MTNSITTLGCAGGLAFLQALGDYMPDILVIPAAVVLAYPIGRYLSAKYREWTMRVADGE